MLANNNSELFMAKKIMGTLSLAIQRIAKRVALVFKLLVSVMGATKPTEVLEILVSDESTPLSLAASL